MKRKKIILILTVSLLALSLAACGKKDSDAGDGEGMTDETYEADAYGEEEYESEDYEAGDDQANEEQRLKQERQPKSIQELVADKPKLLDAARFDGFQADQSNMFREFTYPYNSFGELDMSRSFTFRSDGTYSLAQCSFGKEHNIGSFNLSLINETDETLSNLVYGLTIELNESFRSGIDLAEDYEDDDTLVMLDEILFFEADEEYKQYTLYKVVGGPSASGEAGSVDKESAEEALQELDNMGIDSEELLSEAAELADAEGKKSGDADSGKKKLDISRYEETNVVEITMQGDSEEEYDQEQVKDMLLSVADCVSGDNGAPFLQDLVCVTDFNGFSVKDPALLARFSVSYNSENATEASYVKLIRSVGDNNEETGVLELKSQPYYEQGYEYETIEVFGKDFCCYGMDTSYPALYTAGEGTLSSVEPGPDDKQNLEELIEEFLQFN